MNIIDEDAVSPVVSVILVVFITLLLAVGVFVMVGGMGSDQGTASSSYSKFSSDGSTYSAMVMDGGNAEELTYLVNGQPVYTVYDPENAVGRSVTLSAYAQLCEGDALTVVGRTGNAENTIQTETVPEDINCGLPDTEMTTTVEHDGSSWIIGASLTNLGDTTRDYSLFLTDGDTFTALPPVRLAPGESTSIDQVTTDAFAADAPLRLGVSSPAANGGEGYTLALNGNSASYVGGTAAGVAFTPLYEGSRSTSPTVMASPDGGNPLSLSANRVAVGEIVELYATITTTKETANENVVVRATNTKTGETEVLVGSPNEYSVANGEYTYATEPFSFDSAGEYVITATLEGSGIIHTAGTVTVIEGYSVTVESSSVSPATPSVGDELTLSATLNNPSSSAADVTVQFFSEGEVVTEHAVTVPANDIQEVSATFTPTNAMDYRFHVGVVEPAIVEHIDTVTVSSKPTGPEQVLISDGFESGLSPWEPTTPLFERASDHAYNGEFAAYMFSDYDHTDPVIARRDVPESASRPTTLSYYWRETTESNGGGIRVVNSNDEVEVAFASDNPQWYIYDRGGFRVVDGRTGDSYYQRWIHVEITFHWESGTYDMRIEDLHSNHVETVNGRNLVSGTDVAALEIATHHRGEWTVRGFEMWFDDIELRE